VEYTFNEGSVWRRDAGHSARVLAHVARSSMARDDAYQRVTALRWELEMETTRTNARIKPLFTFKAAVPRQQP
jgi:hypothetical protein